MFRGKHAEAECRPQGAQLLAPCLVARGVIGECPRGNAKLASNKGECCLRNDLARAQQAPGIAESTELQRETKLVGVAATTLYGGEIGDTQGPVPDQFRFGDRQGKQLIELLAGDGAASRHGQLSQYGAGPNRGNGLRPVKRGECNRDGAPLFIAGSLSPISPAPGRSAV